MSILARTSGKLRRVRQPQTTLLRYETLEDRCLLSVSLSEAYAWYIVNKMREDPPLFARQLEGVRTEATFGGAHGYAADDPLWDDLRSKIANSQRPGHFDTAMSMLKAQPRLGPFAFHEDLEAVAQTHNNWMEDNEYAHNTYPWPDWANRWGAQNIGYGHGLSNCADVFGVGSNAYQQRMAYVDTIGFMIEVNSVEHTDDEGKYHDGMGHLRNLLSRDSDSEGFNLAKNKEIGVADTFGVDFDWGSTIRVKQADGTYKTVNSDILTTHQLANNGEDSYVTGIAYQDLNNNGYYDRGEGLTVEFDWAGYRGGLGLGGSLLIFQADGTSTGIFEEEFRDGTTVTRFEVTSDGRVIGELSENGNVYVDDGNHWLEIRVPTSFHLASGGVSVQPTMAADFYEGGAGNDTASDAIDLGTIGIGHALNETDILSIHNSSDRDWFQFELEGYPTSEDEVYLGFQHSEGDIDARLYRLAQNGQLDSVDSGISTSDNEVLSLDGLGPGRYYVEVYGYSGATNFYSLDFDIELADGSWFGTHREVGNAGYFIQEYNRNGYWDGGDRFQTFGYSTDTPIIGDWNGDGKDEIGVHRAVGNAGYFILDYNGNGYWDAGDTYSIFGYATDTPIVGDWDGLGKDEIGVHRAVGNAGYFIQDFNGNGYWDGGDRYFEFGYGTDTPIIGDWNGNGTDNIGVHRNVGGAGYFIQDYDDNGSWDGEDRYFEFGYGTDTPIIGDWDDTGDDEIGVHREVGNAGYFIQDYSSNGSWDGEDRFFEFGYYDDIPIIGNWAPASPLVAAEGEVVPDGIVATLKISDLAPIVEEALASFEAIGLDARMKGVEYVITDLPGAMLGLAEHSTIYLDYNAAGHGWFVDLTPAVDEEFERIGSGKSLYALDPVASDTIDLLTVVSHELGHVLGLEDLDPESDSLMSCSLEMGSRHRPGDAERDAVLTGYWENE